MTFYDKNGNAICYTIDNIHLYSFDGQPLGYIHRNKVWAFSGVLLGWFHNYWIIDREGYYIFFSEYSIGGILKPLKHLQPLKSLRHLRPLKGYRQSLPLEPLIRLSWSSLTPQEFFNL